MFSLQDNEKRIGQRTCVAEQLRNELVSRVGERRFIAYQLVFLQKWSLRAAARAMGCDDKTTKVWARQTKAVVEQMNRELQTASE